MKRSLSSISRPSRLPLSCSRASSTSRASSQTRASSSTQSNTPSLQRTKSSLSLRRTPQSVTSSRNARPKKKDNRPIQDKTWQAKALERVQHYFQQCPEAKQLLNKGVSIRPITLNMFVQLTNVVLKNMDSNFHELALSNYIEILPIHLNSLKYPGVMTASTLKTANTMHSWPHILAILAWLVELHELSMMINVEETILDIPPNAPLDVQVIKSEIKLKFEFFQQFNQGKTDEDPNRNVIENMYKTLCHYSDDEFEHYSKELNKLQEELQNQEEILVNDQQICSTFEDEYTAYADKYKHFNELIEMEEQFVKDVNAKKEELLRELENNKRTINNIKCSNEKLKDNIRNQPMNLIQHTNMLKEIDDLKRQIELIQEEQKYQLNLRDEKDMKLSEVKREIEQLVLNYNIELMRPSLKHPELNQITLRQDKLLQSDMKEFINNNIEMKQQLLNDLELNIKRKKQETLSVIKHQTENEQQNYNTKNQEIKDQNTKQLMLNQQLELMNQDQAKKQKEDEIKESKQKLSELKKLNPNLEEIQKQLEAAKINCEELKNKMDSKHAKMDIFFEKILEDVRTKQIPRYEKIRKGIIEKVDKGLLQYSTPPTTIKK